MYRFSLQFFFDMVATSLQELPKEKSAFERLRIITRNLFFLSTARVTRSMFQVDHLPFALRMAQVRCGIPDAIGRQVKADDWELLLSSKNASAATTSASAVAGGAGVSNSSMTGASAGDYLAASASSLPALVKPTLPPTSKALLRELFKHSMFSALRTLLESPQYATQWAEFFADAEPAALLPDVLFPPTLPHALKLFYQSLVVKALRPDAFTFASERFIRGLFDFTESGAKIEVAPGSVSAPIFFSSSTAHSMQSLLKELTPFTPMLLVSSTGYDASVKVEELARTLGVSMQSVAMGSPEGYDEANRSLAQAMRVGSWVLLKNVHLAGSFLSSLEKRLHQEQLEGRVNENFRLFLSSEVSNKIPPNLIANSRVMVFEPPPGIKSNLLRTLGGIAPSSVSATPKELPRLYFIAAWFHAVVMERMRFLPLGWSKRYEFSEADFQRTVGTIRSWVRIVAKDKQHVAPQDLPWRAIHRLVSETVYGGRIDNPFDQTLLETFCDSYFGPQIFDAGFSLIASGGGSGSSPAGGHQHGALNCNGVTLLDFQQWIQQLPDMQPPEWLGLPSNATVMVRTALADDVLLRLHRIQLLFEDVSDADAASSGDSGAANGVSPAASGAARWAAKFLKPLQQWHKLLSGVPFKAPVPPSSASSAQLSSSNSASSSGGEALFSPLALALSREASVASALLKRVVQHLDEMVDICQGTRKATNVHRMLLEALSKDDIPKVWRRYTVPTTMTLSAWVPDFARRLAFLSKLLVVPPSALQRQSVPLGWLLFPEAFLTATRQDVARRKAWPLEQLVMSVRMFSDGAAVTPGGETSFDLAGVVVSGAQVSAEGVALGARSDSTDAASSTPLRVLRISWERVVSAGSGVSGEVSSAAASSSLSVPVYLNATRADVLCVASVPVDPTVASHLWYQQGLCLTVWSNTDV